MNHRDTLDPKLDIVFKMLFGHPDNRDLLISLLSAVLRPTSPIRAVRVESEPSPTGAAQAPAGREFGRAEGRGMG
jgi:hypothetical protein